jgi:hypothetical protein
VRMYQHDLNELQLSRGDGAVPGKPA